MWKGKGGREKKEKGKDKCGQQGFVLAADMATLFYMRKWKWGLAICVEIVHNCTTAHFAAPRQRTCVYFVFATQASRPFLPLFFPDTHISSKLTI